MAIKYRAALPEDYEDVNRLMLDMGWKMCIPTPESFCKVISNSVRTIVALDESHIVGFGRAISDDYSIGYITDVAISSDHQGRGIGRSLVRNLMGDNQDIKWIITAAAESMGFWEKQGFVSMSSAMERPRRKIKAKSEITSSVKKISSGRDNDTLLKKVYRIMRSVF